MFPRYPLYDRVGQYIYDKVLWRMAPDAKTKGEPNDRRISDETFIEHESLEVHEHNGSPAAERNKRQQRRKMRERASTVTAWPMMEGDIELEDMEIRNVREFV
jgi:hypothetical protein